MEAPGRAITTIEGLSASGKLHPIQQALVEHGGTQCGFCTPGIVLSAKALLDANPRPTEADIRPRHRRQPVPLHGLRQDRRGHRGRRRSRDAEPMAADTSTSPAQRPLEVVGKRLPRVDARERVTGEAVYPADLALPGTVHAKLKRSPHAHARIRRVDTSRAEALAGVLAVVTAVDFPELPVGATIPMGEVGYDMWMVAQLNIARHKVHWVGQPVAGVAAVDVHVAEAALALIEVEYEPLPAVLDIAAAMAPDAPVLHEHVLTKGVEPRPRSPSNVCSRTLIARGDAARALTEAAATARVERREWTRRTRATSNRRWWWRRSMPTASPRCGPPPKASSPPS